jgi:hypothetical protein
LEYRYTADVLSRILESGKDRYTPTSDSNMGVFGKLYANTLLFIADVSVRLLAPGPETIVTEEHRKEMHEAETTPTNDAMSFV